MRRDARVPARTGHGLTVWHRTRAGVLAGLLAMFCLASMSLSPRADADVSTLESGGVLAQPTPTAPEGPGEGQVSFRVLGEEVPAPPPEPPPGPIAGTGLNALTMELVGLALTLLVLGIVFVAATFVKRGPHRREHG